MKTKVIKCKHYKGTGTTYKFNGTELNICDKCDYELRNAIFEQQKLENELTLIECQNNELKPKKKETQ